MGYSLSVKLDNIKFILDSNIHDEDVKLKLNTANQSLERLKEIDEKIRLAKRQWEEIDQISLGWDVVMNDGIPLLMNQFYINCALKKRIKFAIIFALVSFIKSALMQIF